MYHKSETSKKSPEQESFFEDAYRKHLRKVQFYAMSYLADDAEAKSVAQDVFLTLWENLGELDTEKDILPYLLVVAKFKCMNIIRKGKYYQQYRQKRHSEHIRESIAYEALSDFTSTTLYSSEINSLVDKSLGEMPEKVKDTYILSRVNNLKNHEIAKEQLISIKTVEYRLNYAFRILRKNLHDYLFVIIFVVSLHFL